MDRIELINKSLVSLLHEKAQISERLRQNCDLRTTPEDGSQRMLNVLEPGTKVAVHRHLETSETAICVEGCINWIFYEELPNVDEICFKEVARFRICPREGQFGIQIPKGAWHSIEVLEPSAIFEAKDGPYVPGK